MNVLVTGAKCMVGTALYNNLKNIRDRKNKTQSEIVIEEIYEYDLGSTAEELDESYQKSDFVFNLAGVNRPENPEDFMKGNYGFTSALLNCLKKHNHKAIIMLSSSIQHEPFGFHDYNCLQMNAFCVVNDSGTLSEESNIFTSLGHPFPAVCIRTSTERPEALDKACFVLAGIDDRSLLQVVDTADQMNLDEDYGIPVHDYVEENVSSKVVKIIQSYTGVVYKIVWGEF